MMTSTRTKNVCKEKVYRAKNVYLLMRKDYRISRNSRALWFLEHINKDLSHTPLEALEETDEELQILSVIPDEEDEEEVQTLVGVPFKFQILPKSVVSFLAKRYRLVFVLDISPSAASVDLNSKEVLLDKLFKNLSRCVRGLVKPFTLPGSNLLINVELYVSVIAHTPMLTCTKNQVLAQGIQVTETNIDTFLDLVQMRLEDFEQDVASAFTIYTKWIQDESRFASMGSESEHEERLVDDTLSIVSLIRQGLFAVQLLPENSSSGIVIITDGMLGSPDAGMFDNLIYQLRCSTVTCSFLKAGETYCARSQFGNVPHSDLLEFITTATFGAYFASCPDVTKNIGHQMNIYQRALFLWTFQKGLHGFKYELSYHKCHEALHPPSVIDGVISNPVNDKTDASMMKVRKKHLENKLSTCLFSVLSCRIREGYTIKDVCLTKGGTQIEVKLALAWKDQLRIEYTAVATWPLDPNKRSTSIDISIEGSYDLVHDVLCTKQRIAWSQFRVVNVKRIRLALQRLPQTDTLLVHLQSFGENSVNYQISDSIKSGVPVFHMPHSAKNPVLNSQLNVKDNALMAFAHFWKPVANLDIKVWQTWMHVHRISMVLEHDIPLHKHVHAPNASGRFSPISCLHALNVVSNFLLEWSTFVLLENNSYVKFLTSEGCDKPDSFVLLRVTSTPPCLVLRLAFLGGTPGAVRHKIITELKNLSGNLKFVKRGLAKTMDGKPSPSKQSVVLKSPKRTSPLMRDWQDIFCCIVLSKPIEHVLISYERVPHDMTVLEDPSKYEKYLAQQQMTQLKSSKATVANVFNVLCRYLHHQRWIWTIKQGNIELEMPTIGIILSTLAQIRLQEGFHFISSKSGIVNMVTEVNMRDSNSKEDKLKDATKCVVQYIIFPPFLKTSLSSMSEDDFDESESTEADREVQIVTECWTEPQHGISFDNPQERSHWDGMDYTGIARSIYPSDLECLTCLVTFEHLQLACNNKAIPEFFLDVDSCLGRPPLYRKQDFGYNDRIDKIHQMPLPFDVLSLLPKSRQAELVFSTFRLQSMQGSEYDMFKDSRSPNILFLNLIYENFKEIHDKEVKMSSLDNIRFLNQLTKRKRPLDHPLPFNTNSYFFDLDDDKSANRGKSLGRLAQEQEKLEDFKKANMFCPAWKCFVRVINSTRLILTFIPASYNEILKLNEMDHAFRSKSSSVCEDTQPKADKQVSLDDVRSRVSVVDLHESHTDLHLKEDGTGHLENIHRNASVGQLEDHTDTSATLVSDTADDIGDHENIEVLDSSQLCCVIPVYTYECAMNNVKEALIHPWTFELPEDTYLNNTFQFHEERGGNKSPMKRFSSMDKDMPPLQEDMDNVHQILRQQEEKKLMENSQDEFNEILKKHCDVITDAYQTSYVNGVYQCLQKDYYMDPADIELAINNLCTESSPLETDITTFLLATCQHFRKVVDTVQDNLLVAERKSLPLAGVFASESTVDAETEDNVSDMSEGMADSTTREMTDISVDDGVEETLQNVCMLTNEEVDEPQTSLSKLPSVRFTDLREESDSIMSARKVPSVFQLPKTTVNLHTELLDNCEYLEGLHTLISNKFKDVVQKWFKEVPNCPNYYIYCCNYVPCDSSIETDTGKETDPGSMLDRDFGLPSENESATEPEDNRITAQTLKDAREAGTKCIHDKLSLASNRDSGSYASDVEMECGTEEEEEEKENLSCPLFIHFTCTLKSHMQFANVSVNSVATCLDSLLTASEKDLDSYEFNLGDLKITFDICCLTLSLDNEEASQEGSFHSSLSQGSSESSSPLSQSEEDLAYQSDIGSKACGAIGHLPELQRQSILFCKEELEWLMEDEVVSALRHLQPVKTDALEYVKEHVKQSVGRPNCRIYNTKLFFVYGKEKGLNNFKSQLTMLRHHGYRLISEGNFYYVVCDNLSSHANVLNTKLIALSQENTPAKKPLPLKLNLSDGLEDSPMKTFVFPSLISSSLMRRKESQSQNTTTCSSADISDSGLTPGILKDSNAFRQGCKNYQATKFSGIPLSAAENLENPMDQCLETEDFQDQFTMPFQNRLDKRCMSVGEEIGDNALKKSLSFGGFSVDEANPFPKHDSFSSLLMPLKSVSGMSQLKRSRHSSAPSGQQTINASSKSSTIPQTPSFLSSQGSVTDVGYDGDSSDMGECTPGFNELKGKTQPVPHFWLIMSVEDEDVNMYFHYRETGQENKDQLEQQKKLIEFFKKKIDALCHKVNQKLLLDNLYETRICHSLLVPESDDEVKWHIEAEKKQFDTSDTSYGDEDEVDNSCLAYNLHLKHKDGYFGCELKMEKTFIISSRLKMSSGRTNVSRGFQALKSVLNNFSINRKDMFVIMDSSNKSVFYARMKEHTGISRQISAVSNDDISVMGSGFQQGMLTEGDELSLSSSNSLNMSQRASQDYIELKIYGIEEVGQSIRIDLMTMLQNRLDDAVLESLYVQLQRNPASKLSAEDVRFIQKPCQPSAKVLRMTVPIAVNSHLSSLLFYLKQNILQFCHTPNYADNKPRNRFQHEVNGTWQATDDSNCFLYIRPHSLGGKAICGIAMTLVDDQGLVVRVLNGPKPSRTNHSKLETLEDLKAMIQTEICRTQPSLRPGLNTMIQFRIWERGSCELDSLQDKLMSAVQHALCDIVMEYYLLTAPICLVSQQLLEMMPVPAYSAPSSPIGPKPIVQIEIEGKKPDILDGFSGTSLERRHSSVYRKLSESIKVASTPSHGGKSQEKTYTPSPLQSLRDALTPKTRIASPPPESHRTFDFSPSPVASTSPTSVHDSSNEIANIIRKYEEGDRGKLHPVFGQLIKQWMVLCESIGVPAVSKCECILTSCFSLDNFLKEFQTIMSEISSDISLKTFQILMDSEGNFNDGYPYLPNRIALRAEEQMETSLDYEKHLDVNDQKINVIVIGRNFDQWQASIQDHKEEEFSEITAVSTVKAIPKEAYQKFSPLLSNVGGSDKNKDNVAVAFADQMFAPRQRLVLLFIEDKQVKLYTYNLAGDLSKLLDKKLTNLSQWLNTRTCLLDSIISQKLGLFHHNNFFSAKPIKSCGLYVSGGADIDNLINSTAPPKKEPVRQQSHMCNPLASTRNFDEAFKDTKPSKPMFQTLLCTKKDPVVKHGMQTQELRAQCKHNIETLCRLNKLFVTWFERSIIPVSEESILLLKQCSRVYHYCSTPLLFHPIWRQKVMGTHKSPQKQSQESKVRSRHSSGTSNASVHMRSKRSDSVDGKKRPTYSSTDLAEVRRYLNEESWHTELRTTFSNEYIQYIHALGFAEVHSRPATPKRSTKHGKKSSFEKVFGESEKVHGPIGEIYYLQKTLSGGIILIELSFRQQYFFVKLFACEVERIGASVDQQISLEFLDECDHLKDVIHVHSFAHDFHLRYIHSHIIGEQLFMQSYHLTGFLSDFMQIYPDPPRFSRNLIYTDTITFPLTCSGQNLYEYMLVHVKAYGMKVIAMVPTVDADIESEYHYLRTNEYALVQHTHNPNGPPDIGPYNVGLVIAHDSQTVNFQNECERNKLQLHFFILLMSSKDLFPRATDSAVGDSSKHNSSRPQGSPIHNLLLKEAYDARTKITDMVKIFKNRYRKDLLWQSMLISEQSHEDCRRKKRSETDESRDGIQRLTFEEFQELLNGVVKKPLHDFDDLLLPLENMNVQWYKSLFRILQNKYMETSRCFASDDGIEQYILILNPNDLDMCMMLMINNKSNTWEMCAMFKDALPDESIKADGLPIPVLRMQAHVEAFVNMCCFHLWASMI